MRSQFKLTDQTLDNSSKYSKKQGEILIIGINFFPEKTGISPYTTEAALGLADRGYGVKVITGFPHYPEWKIPDSYLDLGITSQEKIDSVNITRLRHYVPQRGSILGRIVMEISFGARSVFSKWGRPDVIILPSPALLSSALVTLRALLSGIPTILWVQDIYSLGARETKTKFSGKLLEKIEGWTARSASKVIAIHERFKKYICTNFRVEADSVAVVRNWTHIKPAEANQTDIRKRFGWSSSDIIVLHAGNMGVKQNLENVVNASVIAAKECTNVKFVLLGDGHRRKILEDMGSNDCLQFIDPLPDRDFSAVLDSADILLINELPGMTEMSVPSKLTSYFASGKAVVAAVDPGSVTAEEIRVSGGGVCVNPNDPRGLLDSIQKLIRSQDIYKELSSAGTEYCRRYLSQTAAIEKIEFCVLEVIEISGLGETKFYENFESNTIQGVKSGS